MQIVRDEHGGHADAFAERGERVLQLGARNRVQRAERLVEQQHRRLGGQRARDRDALALTAGQLARPPIGETRRVEPHERERVAGARRDVRLTAEPQHKLDVPLHAPVWKQAAVLRDVADPPPKHDGVDARGIDPIYPISSPDRARSID